MLQTAGTRCSLAWRSMNLGLKANEFACPLEELVHPDVY